MDFFDAHFHLIPSSDVCGKDVVLDFYKGNNLAITCAHSPEEFIKQDNFIKENGLEKNILQSFGIHPQMPVVSYADFLEQLLKDKKIKFIGECGYDLFTPEFKSQEMMQKEAFNACLELAAKYHVPLIVHNRKALDLMFKSKGELKNVPLVLFHSFAFSAREAFSILNHNVNGYFSFSKQILNGNKKSISCIKELPLDRLFLETDAPYQTLKGERYTLPSEIEKVYRAAAEIKQISLETLCNETMENAQKIFI